MHLSEQYSLIANEMSHHFAPQGLVMQVQPVQMSYDYVLMLGSTYNDYKSRLQFLAELFAKGVRFRSVALLGSHRLLLRQQEIEPMMNQNNLSSVPLTEIEMMDALFMQTNLKGFDSKKLFMSRHP